MFRKKPKNVTFIGYRNPEFSIPGITAFKKAVSEKKVFRLLYAPFAKSSSKRSFDPAFNSPRSGESSKVRSLSAKLLSLIIS
ncbi:hypothetical protein Q4534_00125 [Cyclobacterium sp. 1_MG-2023]|nr:hypothetical protein [Cyclobacterium sp. 1_MG-2023]